MKIDYQRIIPTVDGVTETQVLALVEGKVIARVGIAAARGIAITVPEQSSLLDACAPEAERLYGYDCADVYLDTREDGGVKVRLEAKPVPAAAEVEDTSSHVAEAVPA